MGKRLFTRLSSALVIIVALLVFTSSIFAQGRSSQAFERVRAVKERNLARFLSLQSVEGVAIGLDKNSQTVLKVFTSRPGVGGIPAIVEGVPVQIEVSGRFYALKRPTGSAPGKSKRPPKDTTAPDAPTDLQAKDITNSSITLTWTASIATDVAAYNVYCSMVSGGPYSFIGSTTVNSYLDNGLLSGTAYFYVVTAEDAAGNESSYSSQLAAATSGTAPPPEQIVDREGWCSRPVPIGVSTGHPDITAGTIGCRVTDGTNFYALSNNHVYANMNKASIGDNVLQPGTYDGGIDPDDAIGVLSAYVPIIFYPRGINYVDAAIALIDTDDFGNPLVGYATPPVEGYGAPSSVTLLANIDLIDQPVQKYGRTTGLQHGVVDAINFSGFIYYGGRLAYFADQIVITPGTFSAGGDSGSLIVTDDSYKKPVALLFAGSDTVTIANPIDWVLEDLADSIGVNELWIDDGSN